MNYTRDRLDFIGNAPIWVSNNDYFLRVDLQDKFTRRKPIDNFLLLNVGVCRT
uniref:Uncharacterized protein n=1 Tax=Candidatus Kentrum sp. FM TaxID=2126340 RepID=A0A450TWW5_9GAMM|nr:MAG: hypothetical protein BECKFM1743A_GA0114220_107321 [Candidatus Kentron sp. FM]VFK20605.1 MAG: hypothetical protein BECKFM1743B_GA0114221_107111 [Candidatus Kentron sp. FM]